MGLVIGNNKIGEVYLGNNKIESAHIGNEIVYESSKSLTSGILGAYKFENNMNSSVGYVNTGIIGGGTYIAGKQGKGLRRAILKIPPQLPSLIGNLPNWTISLWKKTIDFPNYIDDIMNLGTNNPNNNDGRFMVRLSRLNGGLFGISVSKQNYLTNTIIINNSNVGKDFSGNFHHFVLTRNNNIMTAYLDGVLIGTGTSNVNLNFSNNIVLGSANHLTTPSSDSTTSDYDEIYIYNKTWTLSDVEKVYNKGIGNFI